MNNNIIIHEVPLLQVRVGAEEQETESVPKVQEVSSVNRKFWTEQEKEILREYYPTASKRRILEFLPHRSWYAISQEAEKLGIARTHRYIKLIQPNLLPISEVDAAWLACAVDSEGYVSMLRRTYKGKTQLAPRIEIKNTSIDYVEKFAKLTGGVITGEKKPGRGLINSKKRMFIVRVMGAAKVWYVLGRILPYFIIKKKQAQLLHKFCELQFERWRNVASTRHHLPYLDRQFEIYEKMKRLNHG